MPDSWPRSPAELSVHHAAHRTGHANVGGGPLEVGQGSLTTKVSPSHIITLCFSPADSADCPDCQSPQVWIPGVGSSCCLNATLLHLITLMTITWDKAAVWSLTSRTRHRHTDGSRGGARHRRVRAGSCNVERARECLVLSVGLPGGLTWASANMSFHLLSFS